MLPALAAAGAQIAGGLISNAANKKAAKQQYRQQKEFAQSGIQWRVKDAEKAGIHPLYALGAQTHSYAPQSVGGQDFSFLADAGQNIGRAIDATRSNQAKGDALALTASQVQLEGLKLDNDIKRAQLASAYALANQSSNPGLPTVHTRAGELGMSGQGNSPQLDRYVDPEQLTSIKGMGVREGTDTGWSNAQTYEDRYGEMSDYIYGPAIWMADKLQQRKDYFDRNLRPYFVLENGKYKLRRP